MKNIVKLFSVFAFILSLLTACDRDADRNWTTTEPSFRLYNTSLDAVLYPTMRDNPFILVWDKSNEAIKPYSVFVSSTENFANKVQLGVSEETNFRTTIGALNTAMLQAGLTPYNSQNAYIRVETAGGSVVSNTISFAITTYPADGPVITEPTAGKTVVLDKDKPEAIAATVKWSDYASYGVAVDYIVEVATKGSKDFFAAGTVKNEKSLGWTNVFLNNAVLKTGAQADVENEIDVRVTATTKSTGGTIIVQSAVVSLKVTPYSSFTPLYLVGDATAAKWENKADNMGMFPLLADHGNSNAYTFTGYFKSGSFKIIKEKGSWATQYGFDSEGVLSMDGLSKNIPVPADGYYKLTVNIAALTYTLTAIASPIVNYPTIGIIGDATPSGWDGSTAMVQSDFDPHIWYLADTALKSGLMKFRANNSWDVNWGSADSIFGTGTNGGDNIAVEAGTYDIYFNDFSGDFVMLKK